MTEPEKKKQAASENEDWAVLPFDEAEDDARWARLIEETDELIIKAEEMEAVHGPLLMENKLSDLKALESEAEDNPF
jgi:predicted RNA polymerase sigma factor